jgi:sterol desaturase/sphingolipid hydroxylase (fatty acid hydroxylase superfamily)
MPTRQTRSLLRFGLLAALAILGQALIWRVCLTLLPLRAGNLTGVGLSFSLGLGLGALASSTREAVVLGFLTLLVPAGLLVRCVTLAGAATGRAARYVATRLLRKQEIVQKVAGARPSGHWGLLLKKPLRVGLVLLALLPLASLIAMTAMLGWTRDSRVFEDNLFNFLESSSQGPEINFGLIPRVIHHLGLGIELGGGDLRGVVVLAVSLALEALFVGWQESSLRRLLVRRSTSTWRDIFLFGLQLFHAMPYVTTIFTFGASYLTGRFVNAVVASALHFHVGIATGFPFFDFFLYIVIWSLCEYWDHRLIHTRPLWHLHRMHHTASELNLVTATRNHPALFAFEPLLRVWVAALLAIPAEFVLCWTVLNSVYQLFLHSSVRWNWGWFGRWVLISPTAHRVHHSTAPAHYNTNFSNFLTIWDRVFGTYYLGDVAPVTIGLDEDPSSSTARSNLWDECVADIVQFARDLSSFALGRDDLEAQAAGERAGPPIPLPLL